MTLFCAPQALCTFIHQSSLSPSSLLMKDEGMCASVSVRGCECDSVCVCVCASRPAENIHREIPLPWLPVYACECVSFRWPLHLSLYHAPSDSHQHVSPSVQGQVVRSGEAAVTVCTLEGLHPCVFPVMPRQLIRAGELPGATVPGTLVWLFTWKGSQKTQSMFSRISGKLIRKICTWWVIIHELLLT